MNDMIEMIHMVDMINSSKVSKWYKKTDQRIKNVNFETNRGRFTHILSKPGKKAIKVNLVIKDLYGKISLDQFVENCMNLIRLFFSQKFICSKTAYLLNIDNEFEVFEKNKKS
jgi:hypothetical protein